MNKEQKRYLKEIKALLPVYGKYEKRFFRDIKDSISELESENITYEFLCKELGRPEDLIVNYYQEIDSHYLRKQLKRMIMKRKTQGQQRMNLLHAMKVSMSL